MIACERCGQDIPSDVVECVNLGCRKAAKTEAELEKYKAMARKLQPCPFCKEDELILSDNTLDLHADIPGWTRRHRDFVACGCGARGPAGDTEEQAIKKWNDWRK